MITYGSIYIITKDFEKSVTFYKTLFEKDVDAQNKTRFAIFNLDGLTLSIMNGKFDMEHPDEVITQGEYSALYDDMIPIMQAPNCGKVVINLNTNDLKAEYERIQTLQIGSNMTKIRYINAKWPYYYFSLKDPDNNTIEITGAYENEAEEISPFFNTQSIPKG